MRTIALRGVFPCFLFICILVPAYGQNTFTGTFIADSRPRQIWYLVLTQTGDTVSGSLMIVTPDRSGSTNTNSLSLRGTTDGDAITLTADRLFGDLIINGKKRGETVVLTFPANSGNISTVVFIPTTDEAYNLSLIEWQEELAAIQKEKETLTKLANALSNDIDTAKATGIKRNLEDIQSALDAEEAALHHLENDLGKLKHDASLRPMTCYQANSTVDYDYNSSMGYSYDSRLGYAHNRFMSGLDELEDRISNAEPLVTRIRQGTRALDQAIGESKYPLPNLIVMPGDEIEVLEQYQTLAASAREEVPRLKGTHSNILNKAKGVMREGEAIWKKTQASVRCD